MGRRTRRGSASANAASQSTSVPRTYASASEVRKRAGPPSPRCKGRDYGRPLELSQDGLGDLLDAEGEDRVGTDLDEGPPPLPQELLDRRLEEHRPAQVVEPVLGVHQGCVGGLAGDGGVEGELAGAWLDPGEGREQLLAGRLDLGGVARVAHPDPAGAHPVGLAGALELFEGLGIAGGDHRGGAVHRRQRDPLAESAGALLELLGGEGQRQHAALALDRRQGAAAGGDDQGRVGEREAAGNVGGGDLALGVADHRGRLDPEGAPQPRQRDHHGEEGGLDDVDGLEGGAPGAPRSTSSTRPVEVRAERRVARRRCSSAKTGERSSRSSAIPGHWPPWPGKTNTGAPPPRLPHDPFDEVRRGPALRQARESL